MGYDVFEAEHSSGAPRVTYATNRLALSVGYHWHDTYATITLRRRIKSNLAEDPYWANVHLGEILSIRAPAGTLWSDSPPSDTHLDSVFEDGAALLRTYARDLLEGRNLELLDDIIEKRPRMGVPGLDFQTDEPWFSSREGVWIPVLDELPQSMATYLERSQADDPIVRAVAALTIPIGMRVPDDRRMYDAAHGRLHVLLGDVDPDVRRAAASSLGELADGDAFEALVGLLADETGDQISPIAAAVTFIAIDQPESVRAVALRALNEFSRLGPKATDQVGQLSWRLDPRPGPYPRTVSAWGGPEDWSA